MAIFLVISLTYYLYDIGNIDGVRQGTEALYVQIAKEMAELNSVLTPIYRGEPHWSKPPLQFWLGASFLKVYGEFSLGVARASMAFLSFLCVIWLGYIFKKISKIQPLQTIMIFLGCFGTLKFSRTFMMEVPLMFLPTISLYLFYLYLTQKDYLTLVLAITVGSLAVLVKGQITLVMGFLSVITYVLFRFLQKKKLNFFFKQSFFYFFSILIFSSIWFFLCYLEYGNDFFNYFFLRENIGKFNQVNMPIKRIIEGLLMFSFPWFFLLPLFFKGLKNFKNLSEFQLFSLSCFLGHYLIWFFPKQKSHHYAIPALLYFLAFCFDLFKERPKIFLSQKMLSVFSHSLLIALGSFCLYFSNDYVSGFWSLLGILLSVLSLFYIFKSKINKFMVLTCFSFFTLWSVCLPVFFIPLIPKEVLNVIKETPETSIVLNDRRSFFFEQYLQKSVKVITSEKIINNIEKGNLVISSKQRLFNAGFPEEFVIHRWKKWKRKVRLSDVVEALKHRDLGFIQEDMYLFFQDNKLYKSKK